MFIGENEGNSRTIAAFAYLEAHGYREDLVYTTQAQLETSVIHSIDSFLEQKVDVVVDGRFEHKGQRDKVLKAFKEAGYHTMIVTNLDNLASLDIDEADDIMTMPMETKK
jgi:hypothetical protein